MVPRFGPQKVFQFYTLQCWDMIKQNISLLFQKEKRFPKLFTPFLLLFRFSNENQRNSCEEVSILTLRRMHRPHMAVQKKNEIRQFFQ